MNGRIRQRLPLSFGVFILTSWGIIACAQTVPGGDDALVDTVMTAMRAREQRLLESTLEGSLELTEENEKEPMYTEDGQRCTFGSGLGTVRSRITYLFKNGKWRLDMTFLSGTYHDGHGIVDLPRGRVSKEFSFDGDEARELDRLTGQGVISVPSVVKNGHLSGNVFLPGAYWLVWEDKPLSQALFQSGRPPTLDKDPAVSKANMIVLRSAPIHSDLTTNFLRVWLNADYGYAVQKVALYLKSDQWDFRACAITKMHELEPGLWIPAEWKYSMRNPDRWTPEGMLRTYKLLDAKIDANVDDALFRLDFPPGTLLANNVTHHTEQVGVPDAKEGGDWFDVGLLNQVRQIIPDSVATGYRGRGIWIVAANVVLAALLAYYFVMRRRAKLKRQANTLP